MITNDQYNFVPYNQAYTASKTYKAKIIYAGRTGPDSADQGWTVDSSDQGRIVPTRAGQCRPGPGRAEPNRVGLGGAEQSRAGRSRTGSGRDGQLGRNGQR